MKKEYLFNVWAKGDFSVTTILAESAEAAMALFCEHRGLDGKNVYSETVMSHSQHWKGTEYASWQHHCL